MSTEIALIKQTDLALCKVGFDQLPAIIAKAGDPTTKRFLEFFTATIRNRNTRAAYARAITQFLTWCDDNGLTLTSIEPIHVASWIEQLTQTREPQTVKQHLAALRMLFDWMVTGQCMPSNPAGSVRGPRYSYKKGKTPILDDAGMEKLITSIETDTVTGLRDRALIALMYYTFGRVSAVVALDMRDFYPRGKKYFVTLREKGGKDHEVPLHHKALEYLDAYIQAAGLAGQKDKPLFRTSKGTGKSKTLGENRMHRIDAWRSRAAPCAPASKRISRHIPSAAQGSRSISKVAVLLKTRRPLLIMPLRGRPSFTTAPATS